MKMKRWVRGLAACVLVLTLAACGHQDQTPTPTAQSSSAASNATFKLNWDDGKTASLNDYMAQFGTVMKQSYTRIGRSTSADWFGTSLADYITSKQKLVLDGATMTTKWLPQSGRGVKDQLNVLAVYLDSQNDILYLFVNRNNAVRVYVSQKRPDDNGLINIQETANTSLTAAFQAIAGGKSPVAPGDSSASSSSSGGTVTKTDGDTSPNVTYATQFPANMQRTWYGYSQYTEGMQKLVISGNEMISSDGYTTTIHDESERAADDRAGQPGMTDAHNDWVLLRTSSATPGWINLFGWYQGAGAGTSYKVVLRNLDGSKVEVLTQASGAFRMTDAHYYPTAALADKWQMTMFDDDNVEGDDD